MSLVIEALRRVEKTDGRTGSIGAAVASYRKASRPRGSVVPLLLGVLTGGAVVFLLGTPVRNPQNVSARSGDAPSASPPARLKGAAGLPPPLIIEPAVRPSEVRSASGTVPGSEGASATATADRRREAPRRTASPALVLQAISERDSHPIAIINDQLVREGDKVGAVQVLRIGPDSVEVRLENGASDTVRFPLPPPPPPEASPSPSPHPQEILP